MAPELALGGLQRWLQSVIVHPGTVDAALASRGAAALVRPQRVGDVVLPSATLSGAERIGIYHGMYRLRMAEALEGDYPGLAHFLGGERWRRLASDYVAAHPSTSYTLNVLGRSLPGWLRDHGDVPSRRFCVDLARLEWAVCESFDADDAPRLGAGEVEGLAPEEWPFARLVPSPALRLVALGWNAGEWLDSARDEAHAHPRPRRRAQRVVVFRQEYAVYRREVAPAAFRLLCALAAGRTVGRAVVSLMRRPDAPDTNTLARWFRQWSSDGMFSAIEREGQAKSAPRQSPRRARVTS